ncbi:MAG: YbjQ family protein [Kordiimonas sp.]
MLVTNIDTVPGSEITAELGLVQGSTVRSKHLGTDIAAFFKSLIGGEIKGYSDLLEEGREEAIVRLKENATALGADAVVNVRLTTASIASGAAEMVAYGTAVKLSDKSPA